MTEEREHNTLQDAVDIVDAYALIPLRVIEPRLSAFRFDNTVFPQPARHNLQLCNARPIAADVVDAFSINHTLCA